MINPLTPCLLKKLLPLILFFLAETHVGYNDPIHFLDFNYFPVCRPKSKNGRHFGGLGILYKPHLKPGLKFLPIKNTNYQWVVLKKDFFNISKDIYTCVVYNPPAQSPISIAIENEGKTLLDLLAEDIAEFGDSGDIVLCGDFNARTGKDLDYITGDTDNFNICYSDYIADFDAGLRENHDLIVDSRGKLLLDFCIGNKLRILNGRLMGDSFGKFTCYTPNGFSTVDYVLASESILNLIPFFKVSDFIPTLSDAHCKLTWNIYAKFPNTFPREIKRSVPSQYKWDDDSCQKLQFEFQSPHIMERLNDFMTEKIDISNEMAINDACTKFETIVTDACDKCLKKPVLKKKNNIKHKRWFDSDLKDLRSQLIYKANLMSKYPFNADLKNSYYRLYRIYNKTRKYKAKNHKNNIIKQLDELESNDPKAYWALINSLKEKNDNNIPIAPSDFKSHFEKLNEIPSKYQQRIDIIRNVLKTCEEDSRLFTDLDFSISDSEILTCISKLKNNKSGGLQIINNNILKAGNAYLLPSIKKLFNSILLSGFYPSNWSSGYLSPIFKSGDRSKPENYRE